MGFGSPLLLLALATLPVAVWGYRSLEHYRQRRAARWANPSLLPNMAPGDIGRKRHIPAALFLLALTLLLVGFARPEATLNHIRSGSTVIVTIDVSGSMASPDVRPTRLALADRIAAEFVHGLPSGYRVSLVTFADRPTVKVPPTFDRELFNQGLPRTTELEGTAIGDALAESIKIAKKAVGPSKPGSPHPPAAILLLSDGGDNTGEIKPADAAERGRRAGIPTSTLAIGTPAGTVTQNVPLGPGGKKYQLVQQVPVERTTLRAIAHESGGRLLSSASAQQLKLVYRELASRAVNERRKTEITVVLVGIALATILAGALLSALWFQRLI